MPLEMGLLQWPRFDTGCMERKLVHLGGEVIRTEETRCGRGPGRLGPAHS